jgi:hypothetical protein
VICQFVGGHLDGERREVGNDPPWHINTMPPAEISFSAMMEPVDTLPDQVVYTRHTFAPGRAIARLYAYFNGVKPADVVPIVLSSHLYLTRPRDARKVAANVLSELFRRQLGMWDLRALYDQIKADFDNGTGAQP